MGTVLELVHTWRVPVIYLASALGGSLMHSVIDGNKFVAGASGGVFGLIGARIADILLNFHEMKNVNSRGGAWDKFKDFIFGGQLGQVLFALACCSYAIYDFGRAIVSHAQGTLVTTSYSAHLGGLLVGTLVGVLIVKNIRVDPWENKLKVVCCCLLCAFVLFAICWNVFSPYYPAANFTECQYYADLIDDLWSDSSLTSPDPLTMEPW